MDIDILITTYLNALHGRGELGPRRPRHLGHVRDWGDGVAAFGFFYCIREMSVSLSI